MELDTVFIVNDPANLVEEGEKVDTSRWGEHSFDIVDSITEACDEFEKRANKPACYAIHGLSVPRLMRQNDFMVNALMFRLKTLKRLKKDENVDHRHIPDGTLGLKWLSWVQYLAWKNSQPQVDKKKEHGVIQPGDLIVHQSGEAGVVSSVSFRSDKDAGRYYVVTSNNNTKSWTGEELTEHIALRSRGFVAVRYNG
jgi:hypothetical protein